jgi:hypothetical protein
MCACSRQTLTLKKLGHKSPQQTVKKIRNKKDTYSLASLAFDP